MKSFWLIAIIAIVLGIGTTTAILMLRWKSITTATAEPVEETEEAPSTGPMAPSKPGVTPKRSTWTFWTSEIEKFSDDLKKEKAALASRAQDLDAHEARLASEKQELLKVKAEIEAIRDEIKRNMPIIESTEKTNLKTLAKTYSSMKPQQVISILAEMDDAMVVKIFSFMKPDIVGAIFQEMAKTAGPAGPMAPRAAKLTDQLRLLKKEQTETPKP